IQEAYNQEHGIVPKTIIKEIRDLISISKVTEEEEDISLVQKYEALNKAEKKELLLELENQMKQAAKELDFEKAATLRDTLLELKSGK
ncbi:MAG: UvrB/UvrC motif-containing protein, partial [Vagococcus sp.]